MLTQVSCPLCRKEFSCGAETSDPGCWCHAYPALLPVEFSQSCLCPNCLSSALDRQIIQLLKQLGVTRMKEIAAQYRSEEKPVEGIDYQVENGQWIFSRWYHLKRGYCCQNDCRNCPYPT